MIPIIHTVIVRVDGVVNIVVGVNSKVKNEAP